jgi:PAS domain S-box-containing protein
VASNNSKVIDKSEGEVLNVDKFSRQINTVKRRTETLGQRVNESPVQQPNLLSEAFEELHTALEELQVAEEELRSQNEELAVARNLIESERLRYQELFEFAPDGYLVTDTNGKIQEANRVAAIMLNIPKHFLQGKPLVTFIPEEDRRVFYSHLLHLREMDRIPDWEIALQPRNSIKFYASLSVITVYDCQQNCIGWRWLLRDITARKKAEEQLSLMQLQNLQLQETSRVKSHFLALMSHELRTPMNAILGFAQVLSRQPYHQVSSQSKTMVERIINNGKNLLTLIEDILDFSRLEAGTLNLTLQEFNLEELVTSTTEDLRSLAQQKHLFFDVRIELENPIIINDCDRIRQILVNLISNAIKFTDIGSLTVKLQEVNQDRIALIVSDTGIGIAETDLKNIFKEFRQVNESITRKYGGTGLGLAIVDQLLRLMKGTISVQSKLGSGSTFRVELPRNAIKELGVRSYI